MIWQLIGFVAFYEFSYLNIKRSIKQLLKQSVPDNQRINFEFSSEEADNLVWIKSHEFKLNGRYYDVLDRKIVKGKVHFKCIDDQQETILFKKLDESTALNLWGGNENSPIKRMFQLLQTPALLDSPLELEISKVFIEMKKSHFDFKSSLTYSDKDRILRPPACVV